MPAQRSGLVVAIDGPSGSGKSTVAQGVAAALGLRYLDTGAMYRATTWVALHSDVPLDDADQLVRLAAEARLDVSTDARPAVVFADGEDVTAAIRGDDVTAAVSTVSAIPGVRAVMVQRQRALIADGGIVVEGRDIGTTVAPDADVKIFLTADERTRAARRARETDGPVGDTQQALARRDALDAARQASPLTQPPDAMVIDSTSLTVDQVIDAVVARATSAAGRPT